MKKIDTYYVVSFCGKLNDNNKTELVNVYYADKQPKYNWSFTDDIYKAKLYKHEYSAENLINHAKCTTSYRDLDMLIIPVLVEVETKINFL